MFLYNPARKRTDDQEVKNKLWMYTPGQKEVNVSARNEFPHFDKNVAHVFPQPSIAILQILRTLLPQNAETVPLHRLRKEWIQRLLIRSHGTNGNTNTLEMKKDWG